MESFDSSCKFKRSAFGGFDRKDVIEYITRISAEHKQELETVVQELSEAKHRVSDLLSGGQAESGLPDQELRHANDRISEMQIEIDGLSAAAEVYKSTIESKDEAISDLNSRIQKLQKSSPQDEDYYIAEIAKRDDEIKECNELIIDLNYKNEDLRDQLDQAQAEHEKCQACDEDTRNQELVAYRKAVAVEQRAISKARQLQSQLVDMIRQVEKDLDDTITGVDSTTAHIGNELQKLQALTGALKDSFHAVSDELAELSKDYLPDE